MIFSGVIGPAFSAYFFGASFGVVSGVVLGSGVFFLTYFLNSHNINDSSSSIVNATSDFGLWDQHTSGMHLEC